jgi:hypothetical protein
MTRFKSRFNAPKGRNGGGQRVLALRPLGDIVSSCVFDLDATLAASHSGGDWLNIEPTPADSEAKTEYDFADTGTNQPAFTGDVGSKGAYFLFDGTNHFLGSNTLSTFLDSIHKTTGGSDFTFVCTVYAVSGNQIFMTNRTAGGTNIGVMLYSLSAADKVIVTQRGDTGGNGNPATTAALNIGAWNFIACSHKHSTNETTLWLNSSTGETSSDTFNATTTTASSTNFALGAYGGSTLPLPNTSRARNFAAFNEVLTDAQMALVMTQLGLRHQTTY